MTPDEKAEIYNQGIKAGQAHSVPSDKTLSFMEKQTEFNQEIKTDIALLVQGIKNLTDRVEEKFEENRQDNLDIMNTMNKFIDLSCVEREKDRTRIKLLEDWRLVFVAKFSVYSAIALFAGSMVSALITSWLSGKL